MTENQPDFIPFSSQLGIAGSSYMLQMGKVNGIWAIRLIKGSDVLDSKIFKEDQDMPNANRLTGWVLSVLQIPNINTYQIQKTIGFIRQQALRTSEEQTLKRKEQGKAESSSAKLEAPPEGEVHRTKAAGWVKEEKVSSENASVIASSSPALAASNLQAVSKPSSSSSNPEPVVEKAAPSVPASVSPAPAVPSPAVPEKSLAPKPAGAKRDLPAIPHGEEFVPGAVASPSVVSNTSKSGEKPSIVNGDKIEDILSRLDTLEQRVHKLEKENKELREEVQKLSPK